MNEDVLQQRDDKLSFAFGQALAAFSSDPTEANLHRIERLKELMERNRKRLVHLRTKRWIELAAAWNKVDDQE